MWESLAIRQLGVLESAGSNPAILTECSPHAPREDIRHAERDDYTVVWRNGSVPGCYPVGEGSIPSTTAHDEVVLLGEQSASNTGGVGSNPTDLADR